MIYKPEDFGAQPNDGTFDNAAAFTAMFNAVDYFDTRPVIQLEAGATYYLKSTIFYTKRNDKTTLIEGNNAILKMVGHEHDILVPGDFFDENRELKPIKGAPVGAALTAMDRMHIKCLKFEGGNTQLRLAATFLSIIDKCHFVNGNVGVDGIFALQTQIDTCWINSYRQCGVLLRSGEGDALTGEGKFFSNATGSNSQSNISTIKNCRFFSNSNETPIGIRTYSSSNLTVENTVIEGVVHKHAIHIDSRGSTTVTGQYLRNIHLEFIGDPEKCESLIHVRGGTNIHLEAIYSQYGKCVQAEVVDAHQIFVREWSYVPSAEKVFKTNGGRWYFLNNWSFNSEQVAAKNEDGTYKIWDGPAPSYFGSEFDFKRVAHKGFSSGLYTEDASMYLSGTRLREEGIADKMNMKNEAFLSSRNLDDYEIVDMIPYLQKGNDGKMLVSLQPLLSLKKK